MAQAVGMLEVFGLVTAFVAADAGCKAADVTVEHFDKNKPGNADALPVPLIVCIKFRGEVAAVEAAMQAAEAAAEGVSGGRQIYHCESGRRNAKNVKTQRV